MKPVVRVLAVTDDPDGGFLPWTQKSQNRAFHMGEFIKVLEDTVWLGFNVEIIRAYQDSPEGGETAAQMITRTGADVIGFRFDQGFQAKGKAWTLDDFDMVLFLPQNFPGAIPEAQEKAEAAAIAAFMEKGRGFFATGDHNELGSSIPQWIPRVRCMRRWLTSASPPAPEGGGSGRIDTTRAGPDGIFEFEDQSDEIAQDITVTWWGNSWIGKYPHPLLCSPAGAVTVLPDHMHEGICDVPDNLAARTFQLNGSTVAEFPDLNGEPLSPVLVATGHVIGGHAIGAIDGIHDDSAVVPDSHFGVICAWDGHRVARGRVVVDSTWHHFFNINLTGDKNLQGNPSIPDDDQRLFGFYVPDGMGGRVPAPDYEMIQWYYRNIVYWLIPADRHTLIWWSTLADLVASTPRLKEELAYALPRKFREGALARTFKFDTQADFAKWFYFGQLAEKYLKQARGACTKLIIRDKLYKPKIPWWEWIQEQTDPWGPIEKGRPQLEELWRLQALGLAPKFDALLTAGLGAAVVLAASAGRVERKGFTDKTLKTLDHDWTGAVEGLNREFHRQLTAGATFGQKISRSFERPAKSV